MKIIALVIITILGLNLASWGPFRDCGTNNPSGMEDCDKYSTKTGIGCCFLELQDAKKSKSCILVGGRAQGYLNNSTKIKPMNFSEFNITPDVFNKTLNETIAFNKYVAETYLNEATGIVKCKSTDSSSYIKLATFFLIIATMILFS